MINEKVLKSNLIQSYSKKNEQNNEQNDIPTVNESRPEIFA